MTIIKRQTVSGQLGLTVTEAIACKEAAEVLKKLKPITEEADIVSPYTGQIFQPIEVEEAINFLETILYYDETHKSFEIFQGDK